MITKEEGGEIKNGEVVDCYSCGSGFVFPGRGYADLCDMCNVELLEVFDD